MTTNYTTPQYPQQYGAPQAAPHPVQNPGVAPPNAYAYHQAGYPAHASAPTVAPSSVTTAFWLFVSHVLFSLINAAVIVVALAQSDTGRVVLGSTTFSGSVPFYVVAYLIGNALWAALCVMMFKGHNWARIVITVLFSLSIVGTLITMISGLAFVLTGAATIITGVVGVVMMFRSSSGPWFARR